MNIIHHEIKKIIYTPALIGFVLCCLGLNIALAISLRCSYADYIAAVSHRTGFVIGAEFDERAANLEDSVYAHWFRRQTEGMSDVFAGYTTDYIAHAYIAGQGLTGVVADLMQRKYERLQCAVDDLYASGAGMTLYFAGLTFDRHTQLFRAMMGVLLWQGIILATLIALLSLGYEYHAKTEYVVYATKKGRGTTHAKLVASLTASVVVYIILVAVSLGVYLTLNPFGGTWKSSVSSGFNYIPDLLAGGMRPFITWHGFTIGGYLLASIGISFVLVLCFALTGYIAGLLTRNTYIGFFVVALINYSIFTLNPGRFFGMNFIPTYLFTATPVWIALDQGWWFTDGGTSHLLPHFETFGVLASLALLVILKDLSWRQFARRNLT